MSAKFDNDPIGILAKCATLPFQGKKPKVYSTSYGFYVQKIEPWQLPAFLGGYSLRGRYRDYINGITNFFKGGAGHDYMYPIDNARAFAAKLWSPHKNQITNRFFLLTTLGLIYLRKKTYEAELPDTNSSIIKYEENIIEECRRKTPHQKHNEQEEKIKKIWSETKLEVINAQIEDAFFEAYGISRDQISWNRVGEMHAIDKVRDIGQRRTLVQKNEFWNTVLNTEPKNEEKWKNGISQIVKEADERFKIYNGFNEKPMKVVDEDFDTFPPHLTFSDQIQEDNSNN